MDNFKSMNEREILIYFAGLIDGEGHIGCQYYGARKRPVIQLNMTHKETVEAFANHFGLKCREMLSPSRIKDYEEKGHKMQYQARGECFKALPVIKALRPFLNLKASAADIALAYYQGRICLICQNEIPETRNASSKYCCSQCQKRAKNRPKKK